MRYLIFFLACLLLLSLSSPVLAKSGGKGASSFSGKGSGPNGSAYDHANDNARFKRDDATFNEDDGKEKAKGNQGKNENGDDAAVSEEDSSVRDQNRDRDRDRDREKDQDRDGGKNKSSKKAK